MLVKANFDKAVKGGDKQVSLIALNSVSDSVKLPADDFKNESGEYDDAIDISSRW